MTRAFARARVPVAALAALALAGCPSKEPKKEVKPDPLVAAINALPDVKVKTQEELIAARAAEAEMRATLDEVQQDLVDLRSKELKAIKTSITVAQEGKDSGNTRARLKAEIDEIRNSVRANLDKLEALQKANTASDERIRGLERLVLELHRQLEEKEETIVAIEEKVRELTQTAEGLRGAVKEKEVAVQQMKATLTDRESQLATAFVLIASRDALQKSGYVEKKGSVLGLGGNWQRTGQFDERLFTQIDIRKATKFDVKCARDKVQILSDHPADSYSLASVSPTESTLMVKNPTRFWRVSRQLIVMLPD
jgi:hypothetical protein